MPRRLLILPPTDVLMTMGELSEQPDWQRVSPIAILFFALAFIRRLIAQGMNLLPVVILLVVNESLRNLALQYGIAALILGALGIGIWQFLVFRYQAEEYRLHLRQGLLQRQILTLEYARIQQADIRFPWYYRPFGLAVLSLDSAGSAHQEVVISGLALTTAEQLRDRIIDHQPAAPGSPPESTVNGTEYEFQLSTPEILRYGLMHNGLLVLASLMLPVLNALMQSIDLSLEARFDALASEWSLTQSQWAGMLFLAVLGGIFVLVLASVLVGLVRYQGYRLERLGDRLQSRSGLLSITTRSVRLRRIQMIVLRLSWVGRLLRRQTLVIHTAGDHSHQAQSSGDGERFLVPVLTQDRSQSLLNELTVPAQPRWRPVSFWYAMSHGVQVLLIAIPLLGVLFLVWGFGFWWGLALAVGAWWLGTVWPRWRKLGVYRDPQWLGVREGLIGRQTRWLPVGKIQSLRLSESFWQRRVGVASLHIRGSGGQLTLPYLPTKQAQQWRDELLCEIALHHDTWF